MSLRIFIKAGAPRAAFSADEWELPAAQPVGVKISIH